MKVSVDISMYPLKDGYCQAILDFIDAVQSHDKIAVQVNALSTHIYGDYQDVMGSLNTEMLKVLEQIPETVFVIKLLGVDRNKAKVDHCD